MVPTLSSYKRKPNSHSTESTVPVYLAVTILTDTKKVNVQEIFIERQRTKCTLSCFHVIVIALYTWSTNKFHLPNQINHACNTLLTDSHEIMFPV